MTRQRLVIGESISDRSQVAQPQVVPCGSRKNGRSNDVTPTNVLLSVSHKRQVASSTAAGCALRVAEKWRNQYDCKY